MHLLVHYLEINFSNLLQKYITVLRISKEKKDLTRNLLIIAQNYPQTITHFVENKILK